MKILTVVLVWGLLTLTAGCQTPGRDLALQKERDSLRLEKSRLQGEVQNLRQQNIQLRGQLKVLSGIEKDASLEDIYDLEGVRLGRYTNLYDKDKDGRPETLIVYLQPMDRSGDIVKAAGAVEVELWDLSKEPEDAMSGKWQVKPAELKKLWYDTILTVNYRLTFDMPGKIAEFTEPLTVKVTFTDYITGKVFKEQKKIDP